MKYKVTVILALISVMFGFSQNAGKEVTAIFDTEDNPFKWTLLYKVDGIKQKFIGNSDVKNDTARIAIPGNKKPGMYRLFYDIKNNLFMDFIYNKENVVFTFDPLQPNEKVVFLESKENKLYQKYRKEIPMIQEELDALQLAYLKLDTSKDKKKLQKTYTKSLATYRAKLGTFKKDSEGTLANYYMTLDAKKYPDVMAEDPAAYLEVLKDGYFNSVDFQDERLVSTPLILDKIDNYVINFNASDAIETAHEFQQKATDEVLSKIGGNVFLKEQALTSLLYNYVDAEDIVMTDFLMEKYRSLPNGILDNKVVADVSTKMKMAPGRMAPDFSFEENKELTNLYQLDEHEYYMIVFWSTACSHCVKEIPLVYNMVKEKESLKVIAVALELDELGFYDMTPKFPAFTNVLALNKWENEIPRKYDVHATPSYFLLDKNKRIIFKPENEQQMAKALEVLQIK